jgi:hypothetical protein
MPYCENCGNKVSETTKFCSNCGKEIKRKDESTNLLEQPKFLNHHSHNSTKKYRYVSYILLLTVSVVVFLYLKGNGENKYDSDGNKHGKWVEYINGDGTKEVPVDSARFVRHISYFHGMPEPNLIAKDYYPNGNIQSEYELISGPYTKDGVRPKDLTKGYMVYFDEKTSKISSFTFHDEEGELEIEKVINVAFEKAKKDPRYDEDFLSKTEFGKAIFKYENNSSKVINNKSQKEVRSVNCSYCYGRGYNTCDVCGGSGKRTDYDGEIGKCYRCSGRTILRCEMCNGTGRQ